MIRLTVLYNLPEGADEKEFLKWRLTAHQESNESMPGVLRTDFALVRDCWPGGSMPDYRFQTIAEWPDLATFEAGFYDDEVQAELAENLKRLGEYTFVVSEVVNKLESS